MHEMSVVNKIVKIAEKHARQNNARKVTRLVLQIGELSSVIPDAVRFCYPVCIEETMLAEAALDIEIIPANGACKQCREAYNVIKHEYKCPKCDSEAWDLISGRELSIKEIEIL